MVAGGGWFEYEALKEWQQEVVEECHQVQACARSIMLFFCHSKSVCSTGLLI